MREALDIPRFPNLLLALEGPVARLTLSRVEKGNSLSGRLLEDLGAIAAWIDRTPSIKVVVLDGEGDHFCGGADLLDTREDAPSMTRSAIIDQGRVVSTAIANLRPVTIARLHGRVRGGGAVLALACDLRFAIHGTQLSFPEARLGWPLPWGCVPRLVREVGPMRTKDLVLNARPMSADALVACGLVLFAGEASEVDAVIDDTVANLSNTVALVLETLKTYIDDCADALVPAALGRSDVARFRAAQAHPDVRAANQAGVAALLAEGRIGPRGF